MYTILNPSGHNSHCFDCAASGVRRKLEADKKRLEMERERDQLEAERKSFEEYKKKFQLELMMERWGYSVSKFNCM